MTEPSPPHGAIRCEDLASHADFRRLDDIEGVRIDLRYAGSNNFSGSVLYAGIDCAWLRREAAAGLEQAARWLARERPGYTLLVLDALRPQRVQEAIWADAVGSVLEQYFANPQRGSIHSFGMAVDVTLLDPAGGECDMGSGFDEMSEASHPEFHAEHLALGRLSVQQVVERGWLAAAMRAGGFRGITTEWWHFNWGDSAWVRRELPRVY
jgi:D-alanyl-D-alanine dipeptidase